MKRQVAVRSGEYSYEQFVSKYIPSAKKDKADKMNDDPEAFGIRLAVRSLKKIERSLKSA